MSPHERKWRRALAAGLTALLVIGAALWAVNATALPRELARRTANLISERTGWSVEIGRARFVGLTQLVIEDVDIGGPNGIHGSAPRAYVAVNPSSLLGLGTSGSGLGRVDLMAPHFVVPPGVLGIWRGAGVQDAKGRAGGGPAAARAASDAGTGAIEVNVIRGTLEERDGPGTLGLWRAEGEFLVQVDGPAQLRARRLDMELRAGNVAISARGSGESLDTLEWKASGPADLLLSVAGGFPWEVTGAANAEGSLHLASGAGSFVLEIADGDFRWKEGDDGDAIAFDTARLEIAHGRGEYAVRRLELRRGNASVSGEGRVRLASVAGGESPELEVSLAAKGLSLPEDIPSVEAIGLSGDAEFTGVLSGTLSDPEISGRLKLHGGSVWGRPVDRGEGVILLRRGLFRFGKTELVRGGAAYSLQGEWDGAAARTSIRLSSANGDAEEMLLAAGLDLDVQGKVDGVFLIEVDAGGPRVQGEGEAREVVVLGQPFDAVSGRFSWSPERSRLEGVELRIGEGAASASGEIAGGALDITLTADRWPVPEFPDAKHRARGWISFSGNVGGSLAEPVVRGALRGGALAIGAWSIEEPVGEVSIARDLIHIAELRARGAGQGFYRLSGEVRSWMEEPVLDLDVEVQGASLSGLLSQAGLRIPALLFDGEVSGSIALGGAAASPRADFDLSLADDLGVGDPIRLRFQVDEGRIKLGRLAELLRWAG